MNKSKNFGPAEIPHYMDFYVCKRKDNIDEFDDICAYLVEGEINLIEAWIEGGKRRRLGVPSGHLQKIYERIDVDQGYVYEVEFAPTNLIGFAKITAKYDSDRKAIYIKRRDAQVNSSVGEVYITLKELKDLLGAYQTYLKENANVVEPK